MKLPADDDPPLTAEDAGRLLAFDALELLELLEAPELAGHTPPDSVQQVVLSTPPQPLPPSCPPKAKHVDLVVHAAPAPHAPPLMTSPRGMQAAALREEDDPPPVLLLPAELVPPELTPPVLLAWLTPPPELTFPCELTPPPVLLPPPPPPPCPPK